MPPAPAPAPTADRPTGVILVGSPAVDPLGVDGYGGDGEDTGHAEVPAADTTTATTADAVEQRFSDDEDDKPLDQTLTAARSATSTTEPQATTSEIRGKRARIPRDLGPNVSK